ncbi:hypothetical protein GCM10010149_00160 [Nonomuraea roseoviolacea subsp. roseoviolacea]
MFTAIVYVLTSGCAWRHLPAEFGVSPATAHRRFSAWTRAGLWPRLHRAVLDELGAKGQIDWAAAIVDAAAVRAKNRDRRPDKARADKGYDSAELRAWLRRRGVTPRIARRGIESSERLGRHRRKIDRTIAWIFGYRRLTVRYERSANLFAAFLTLAATLTCWKKLVT